jgi:hypothetical protein
LALICAGLVGQAAESCRFFACSFSIPERGAVAGYMLVLRANRLSFIPPAGWRLKYEANQGSVRLTAPDFAASISVRILPADPSSAVDSLAESLQQKLLRRFPGARIVSVQPCYLSGLEGLAFDLERPTGQPARLASRVCWVPFSGGLAEFCLTTTPGKLKESDLALKVLMTSFEIQAANSGQEPPSPAPR